MAIVERVTALELPLDEIVVIGSGLLDALGLRASHDIDLVVSQQLFQRLKDTGTYVCSTKHDEEVLEKDDVEIWQSWGPLAGEQFKGLYQTGVTIDGIVFCSPEIIIRHKERRGTEKDVRDVVLLRAYMAAHPELMS